VRWDSNPRPSRQGNRKGSFVFQEKNEEGNLDFPCLVKSEYIIVIMPTSESESVDLEPELLELPLGNFHNIYHLSDVHIRPLQRHDEFRSVFKNIESWMITQNEKAIIIVTGDIFDSKTSFRPETILLARNFFKMLSSHAPTVVIAGNHDMMENNLKRLDSLTPMVDDIPNLYYLRQTGIYFSQETPHIFVVSSLYDRGFLSANEARDIIREAAPERIDNELIALYHGTIIGAQLDRGIIEMGVSSRYRNRQDFHGFNRVLLGDIHKHQIWSDKPITAYAGSLIQQNHGESRGGHGILIWPAEANQLPHLVEIENSYGFVDITCHDGQWTNKSEVLPLPSTCYARLIVSQTTPTQIDIIVNELKSLCHKLTVTKKNLLAEDCEDIEIPLDIKRKQDEIELIMEQANIMGLDGHQLVATHRRYQEEEHNQDQQISTAVWRPISVEFRNMFGYGGNRVNMVNFQRGVTSISAGNAHGKTSIVNIILFAIFGRTPLNPSSTTYTFDVVNNRHDNGYVRILLTHGGEHYLIERKTVRRNVKNAASVLLQKLSRYDFTCVIWLSNSKGEKLENKSESRQNNNDSFIKELFGDINDFSLCNLLNKESSLDLLVMPPADQVKTLKRLFKMGVYDTYRDLNKEEIDKLDKEITELRCRRQILESKRDEDVNENDIVNLKALCNQLSDQLQIDESDLSSHLKEINLVRKKVTSLETQLDGCPLITDTVETLKDNLDKIYTELANTTSQNIERTDILKLQYNQVQNELTRLRSYKVEQLLSEDGQPIGKDDLKGELRDITNMLSTKPTMSITDAQAHKIRLETQISSNQSIIDEISKYKHWFASHATVDENNNPLPEMLALFNDPLFSMESINVEGDLSQKEYECYSLRARIQSIQIEERNQLVRLNDQSEYSLIGGGWNRFFQTYSDQLNILDENNVKDLVAEINEECPPVHRMILHKVSETDLIELDKQLLGKETMLTHYTDKLIVDPKGYAQQLLSTPMFDDTCHLVPHNMVEMVASHLQNESSRQQLLQEMSDHKISIAALKTQILDVREKIKENSVIKSRIAAEQEICFLNYYVNSRISRPRLETQLVERETELQQLKLEAELKKKQLRWSELQQSLYGFWETLMMRSDQLQSQLKETVKTLEYWEISKIIEEIKGDIQQLEINEAIEKEVESACQRLNNLEEKIVLAKERDHVNDLYELKRRLELQLSTYDKNRELKEFCQKLQEDESLYAHIQSQFKSKQIQLEQTRSQLALLVYRKEQQDKLFKEFQEVETTLLDKEQVIRPLQEYSKIVGNKGIPSRLLYLKISALTEYINNIIGAFTRYRVMIIYDESKQTINILVSDSDSCQNLSITRLSGYEKLILQLAFKRALNRFSYNSKSSLIIIDEALDCMDDENFHTRLPDIVDLITQDYAVCLVISQRDITHISHNVINIQKDEQCSWVN
jgi:DNA repair exonuclease SbcCD ATPase subunit/DNA repair exonuclease SbcCD nuclease subunit